MNFNMRDRLGNHLLAAAICLEIVTPKSNMCLTVEKMKKHLKSQVVQIDDPDYHRTMRYDAFALEDVLRLGGAKLDLTDSQTSSKFDEIVFTAKDGYSPNTSFDKIHAHRGYLAYAEHGHAPGQFPKLAQGKQMITAAPFYVVWEEGSAIAHEVPWPYQLVKIELVDFQKKYSKLYPKTAAENSAEKRGFLVFKDQCIRCHSINLQGGDLGPELNAPKNVTEYWNKDILKAFIRNASEFRYRDKMPPFVQLSDEQINDVVAYLSLMKEFKEKP